MSSPLKPLGCVFLVGVVARVGAQVALKAYGGGAETFEYEDIANSLLAGGGYTYMSGGTSYVAAVSSPLYVFLTSGLYALAAHSPAPMLVLQALFGAASAVLAGWLAARAFGDHAAWTAGGLVAFDPSLAIYAAKLHPLTFDALSFLLVMCGVVVLRQHPTWRQTTILGALLGLAALTRTTVLSFVPVLIVWLNRRRSLPLVSLATCALIVAVALVYAPWPIRNSLALGQVMPGSSESTEWLWRGMNPNATGSSFTTDGRTMLQAAPADFQARIGQANESERSLIYRDAALQYMRQHPLDAARLYLTKVKSFWFGSETTGWQYPAVWTTLYQAWYAAILLLAAVGVWFGWGHGEPASNMISETRGVVVLIGVSLMLVCLSQATFYVEGRHRLAVEPLVLVLSGGGLAGLARLSPMRAPGPRRAGTPSP